MLDDLALFVHIVEAGSLSAAAKKMDLPAATLTRRLQRLELQLSCQLLHRSARRMLPTPAGQQYYEQCRPLLLALQQTAQSLDANLNQLRGTVRVLAPINLSNGPFRHFWSSFMLRYPEIQLELQLSNHKEDLLGTGADLAIRVGEQADSNFAQRRLGEVRIVLVAAPAYLAHNPPIVNPDSLAQHKLIVADPVTQWHFTECKTAIQQSWLPQGHFRVNEIQLAVHMAREGIGLLYCPISQVTQELQSGELIPVMLDWKPETRGIYAVWPQSRLMPARVRVLLDHLVECTKIDPLFNQEQFA